MRRLRCLDWSYELFASGRTPPSAERIPFEESGGAARFIARFAGDEANLVELRRWLGEDVRLDVARLGDAEVLERAASLLDGGTFGLARWQPK